MIEIIRQSGSLTRQVWQFDAISEYFNTLLVINYYRLQERATKRHGWGNKGYYERLGRGSSLNIDEVPLPDDVKEEALQKFMEQVKVVKELGIRAKAREA